MVPSACFLCPAYGTSGRGDEPHPYFYATVPKICSPCVQKVKCLREAFRIRASDGRVRSCPTVWPLDVPYVHEIGGPHRVGRESGAKETICGLCAQRLGDEDDVRHCGAGSCPLVFHTGCLAMASLEGALLAGSGNLCPFCDGAIEEVVFKKPARKPNMRKRDRPAASEEEEQQQQPAAAASTCAPPP